MAFQKFTAFLLSVSLLTPLSSVLADHELENRDIEQGKTLYLEYCAACHGENLQGQENWRVKNEDGTLPAPPHDETGHTWHHPNQDLFDYTKLGGEAALAAIGIENFNSAMPPFEDALNDDEIWDILGYIRSTWPERIQQLHQSRNESH